ncbi:hypothetical protein [Exiguobacterium sp. SL-9]|uniref:hypothetical protein n=1 Tax=Exiguobacterium sp. SL-9 TaxID=2510963 RepID=UPI00191BCE3D|nr:hypothetical protein [Exiguobacterium sp. SL-9]
MKWNKNLGLMTMALSLSGLLVACGENDTTNNDTNMFFFGDMPYPPEYPKMPGEPKRVQPSRARHDDDDSGTA